ncbi:hypothetical protein HYFRA_00011325 [Hymenoscyphus fraxineus]|uniref:Inner centromere protein ARK-binding domain-containing protein n=1 Tax=Hymenoscyphus fraxineus TaxID=746836 RepID=A0A9N9PQ35_9HELO|nr:hypothetical protein HYFRA_00011325 [Hymenoscyphus fraxineus]
MAPTRAKVTSRTQVGAPSWIAGERASAAEIVQAEAEEFTFSARNEVEWLNEHMGDIFSENHVNVAEIFKTPGKLRGKTPRTIRKNNPLETRAPLSDVFSATPNGKSSPFKQSHFERPVATFQVAEDARSQSPEPVAQEEHTSPHLPSASKSPLQQRKPAYNPFDSGYFGSQTVHATQGHDFSDTQTLQISTPAKARTPAKILVEQMNRESTGSFESAKEELTQHISNGDEMELDNENVEPTRETEPVSYPILTSPLETRTQHMSSPQKRSPQRSPQQSPHRSPVRSPYRSPERPVSVLQSSPPKIAPPPEEVVEDEPMEDVHSPSLASSPLRPVVVRKSSLNFASLPAREPLTTKKSLGTRTSRTSHLDQSRTSYYGRATGGKSLGNVRQEHQNKDDDSMEIDMDENDETMSGTDSKMARLHNKTSTQRLQDQISMLGQSQAHPRPASKSIAGNGLATSQTNQKTQPPVAQTSVNKEKSPERSPDRKARPPPGAFPDEEEDSWIGPPTAAQNGSVFSPRPLTKSHTADVMEDIHGKDSIGGPQFSIPKRGEEQRLHSPVREAPVLERKTSAFGHFKSVSTSVLRSPRKAGNSPGTKSTISVSNPNPSISGTDEETTPPKSPFRNNRGSPLKAAKDKFSSILKTSRGLFASSAAVSADAKNVYSPSSSHFSYHQNQSADDVFPRSQDRSPLYPILDNEPSADSNSDQAPSSSPKANPRRTRASTEREERKKEEEAREIRDAKEAQKMSDQLEKARMKVKEEARAFHVEHERANTMQREVDARKEYEKQAKSSQTEIPRATRTSPRKTKAQLEAEGRAAAASSADLTRRDVDMDTSTMPPPSIPRPKSQIGRPGPKRPLRPAKEPLGKAKPPTVIRVDTGSQRGHQYHPSNSTLAATLQESLSQPAGGAPGLKKKASSSSIQSKASTSSFKATANKALEAAARKKEQLTTQDELAAQKKREAKMEIERQRALNKEEERRKEEAQRRAEAERQREIRNERERAASAADAKKSASRQAAEKRRQELEKAKQTRAPPPAVRNQDKALPPVPREEVGRTPNPASQIVSKFPPKRPLQQDEEHSRPALQRSGPSYNNEQQSKRRKTDEYDDDDLTEHQPRMTAPPIRQSSSRAKDMQPKSLFPSGYANVPPSSNNLSRSTMMSQHNVNQSKPGHPMDMAQMSKGPIPFASSSTQAKSQAYKTPIRPATAKSSAKSVVKSSPQYQNGETIDLPEINTDSEDDDDEDGDDKPAFKGAAWIESPALRQQLTEQENRDPTDIFGPPAPINMEEVFNKSKDKFPKFRDRTSSANWGGIDRLTEDEIRRDLLARQQIQRAGGWDFNSMI